MSGAPRPGDSDRITGDQLLARLLGPSGPEVTCEECFEQLDRYVELELVGADPERVLPGMTAHLAGCTACAEDHESLRAIVRAAGDRGHR